MIEKEIESMPEEGKSGPPWGRIFIWGGLLLLLALLAIGLKRTQQGHVQVGQPAPQFTFTTFDDEAYSTIEHAVDYVDTETEARGYLNKFDITYPNGPDKGTKISQAYRISGVPETYIIGKDGILASVQIGPFRSLDQILSIINPLLEQ